MNVHHLGTLTPELLRSFAAAGFGEMNLQDLTLIPTSQKYVPLSYALDDCESYGLKRVELRHVSYCQDQEVSDFYGNRAAGIKPRSVTFVTQKDITVSFKVPADRFNEIACVKESLPQPLCSRHDEDISGFYNNRVLRQHNAKIMSEKARSLTSILEDDQPSRFQRAQPSSLNLHTDEEVSGFYDIRTAAMKQRTARTISQKARSLSFMLDDDQSCGFDQAKKSYTKFFQDAEISGFYSNKTTANDRHADDEMVYDNSIIADDNNSAPGKRLARLVEMKTKVKNTLTPKKIRKTAEVVHIVATQTTADIGVEEVMVNVLPEGLLPGADREESHDMYTPENYELTYAYYESISENRQQLFRAIYCLGDMLINDELDGDAEDWKIYIEKSDEEVRAWRKKCYKSNDIFEKTGRIMGYDDTKYRRFRLALKKFSLKKFFASLCPSWK